MTEKAERTIEKQWLKKAINFWLVAVFSFLFFFFSPSPVEAGNQQITFQGKLTNSSGNVVSNGTYYVKLTIWDAASGGSCQYTASSTCSAVTSTPVTVTNGIFSINLGDTSASLAAISPTLFNSSALYLGITVCSGADTGCDSEMTPRKRITAAPYAFNADYLSGLATSTIGGQSSYVPVTDSSGNLKISNSVFIATTTAGQFGVGSSTVPSGVKSYVESTTDADKVLVLRGSGHQTGNFIEWQTTTGKTMGYIDSSSSLFVGDSNTTTSTLQYNLLRVAYSSADAMGKFNVDSSGNVSVSGTLAVLSAASSTISSALGINSSTPSVRLVVNGGSNAAVGIFEQDIGSNTASILQLINYDSSNTDKTLDFVLPGGSTAGTIQGLSAANRISIKAGGGNSLVIGAGQSTDDALAFSLNNVPVLVFDGVNDRAIFKSISAVLGDGSTTTTLTKNSLTLGQTSTIGVGKFYVDPSGNTSVSGTMAAFGNTILGDSDVAGGDTTRIYGSMSMGAAPTGNAQVYLKATSTTAVPLLIHNEVGRVIGQFASSSASIILNGVQSALQGFSVLNVGNSSGQAGVINLQNMDESTTGLLAIYRTDSSIGAQLTSGNLLLAGSANTSTLSSTSFMLGQGSGYNQGVFNVSDLGAVNASGTITTAGSIVSTGLTNSGLTTTGVLNVSGNTELGTNGVSWTSVSGLMTLGVVPTGNAQLYIKASSTTAVPLLILDNSGNVIGQFSSSSINAIQSGSQTTLNGYSLLTLGDSNLRAGVLSIRGISSVAPGAIIMYRDATAVGAQLTPGALIVSGDDSTVTTSTFSSLSLIIGQQANYNQGIFYVDSNGNTNVSGTLALRGSSGGVVSSTGGNLRLAADGAAPNNVVDFYSSGSKVLSIGLSGPLGPSDGPASTTFSSFVNDVAGSAAFVFKAQNMVASTTGQTTIDRVLAAFQTVDSGTPTNKVLITAGGHVAAKGVFMASNGSYGIGDMAEYVNLVVGESVEPGDIIIVDTNGLNQYRKSDSAYAKNVAGVISNTGAFIIGSSGEGRAPLALAGLVKTKVTDENGPIAVGDYLVSASKPGYAMRYDSSSGKAAGLVGMALEPLAEGDGKITIMINKGLVAGGGGSSIGLNISQNENGQLAQSNDLDMAGKSIFNLLTIKSKDNKWMIDEDGYLIVKITTKQGDKKLYGLQSGQDKELVLSGSSQLENGLKKIELPLIDQEVVDTTSTIKVSVTLTGEAKGVFVSEKNYQGFTVKELGGGTSNATFDWMLIAKRRATDYQEPTAVESEPASVEAPAPVAPEVASSTPSEESSPALAPIETPVETPPDTSPTPEAPAAEPVVPPAEIPSAPLAE